MSHNKHSKPVYTVLDTHDHDIEFDSLKKSVSGKFIIILRSLITANHRKSGKGKPPDFVALFMRIRYGGTV